MEKHALTDKSLAYIRSIAETGRLKVKPEEYSVEAEDDLVAMEVREIFSDANVEYPFVNIVGVHDENGDTIGRTKIEISVAEQDEEFDYCVTQRFYCAPDDGDALRRGVANMLNWLVNFRSMPKKTMEEINETDRGWNGRLCLAHVGDIIVNSKPENGTFDKDEAHKNNLIRVEMILPVKYTVLDWPEGMVPDVGNESRKTKPAQA